MLIEIHMLKNYPPTNLNRDDLGTPKTCVFGGTNRSRISSQCLKRSWRKSEIFGDIVGESNLGIRTRKMPGLIRDNLIEQGISEEYANEILPKLSGIGNRDGKEFKDNTKTAQIMMYSKDDIEDITRVVKEQIEKCESIKDIKKITVKAIEEQMQKADIRPVSLDIALFGRMVTSDAFRDVEASVQVAHALSTNRVVMESDYFTAVDDLIFGKNQEDSGAGMIDSTEFNSSCYYIYAAIDTDILAENLKGVEEADSLGKKAVEGIIKTMAFSDPDGKQNGFAGHIVPSFAIVECKEKKIPVSYTNAFAEAVYPGEEGDLILKSIQRLVKEREDIQKDFSVPVKESFLFCSSKYSQNLGLQDGVTVCENYEDMVQKVVALLA